MQIQSFQYEIGTGWSVSTFPDMDSDSTLVLIFAAPEFISHPEVIKELAQHYPTSHIVGCSSAGEIAGAYVQDNSLSVSVIRFEHTRVHVVLEKVPATEASRDVGEKIARDLAESNLRAVFILSDGLQINGSELAKGLNNLIKDNPVVITGGLAGDGQRFEKTWAIFNGKIVENSVIAIGLYGERLFVGHAAEGGWDIFGPERRITKSKDNILYELDHQPALKLYKEYLGERAKDLPASGLLYPLQIRAHVDDNRQLVRTILAVNESDQSLTFAGDVPVGYLARLMRTNFDRLITSANEAGELAKSRMLTKEEGVETVSNILSIVVSCVGRRLVLGERTEEETEAALDALPVGTHQVGFYSYGELSPYAVGGCDLHNQSITITTLCES